MSSTISDRQIVTRWKSISSSSTSCIAWLGEGMDQQATMQDPVNAASFSRSGTGYSQTSAWNGEEHGIKNLSQAERHQVVLHDILMLRFLLLYSKRSEKVKEECDPTTLLLEQPSDLAHMPEVATIWRTPIWKNLSKVYCCRTHPFPPGLFGVSTVTGKTIEGERSRLESVC